MITKITVDYPPKKSYFRKEDTQYKKDSFEQAYKDVSEVSLVHERISRLINFHISYPETDVTKLIRTIFGDIHIEVRLLTKKKRVYWIPYLYIHETDKK